jgi:prolyl oligopeptidase
MEKILKNLVYLFVLLVCSVVYSCASADLQEQKKEEVKSEKTASDKTVETKQSLWNYPETKIVTVEDNYFGVSVVDNYQWLENIEDPETKKWTEAQNDLTEKTIFSWKQTNAIEKRLSELWDFDKMQTPVRKGDNLFFRFSQGLQNQPVLYVQDNDGNKKELVNPNKINEEGTTAMDWWYASPNGNYVAYGLSELGSEQSVLHILNVETGDKVGEPIEGCRYASVGWLPDETGFFYSRKLDGDVPGQIDTEQSVRFHKLGTSENEDKIIAKSSIEEGILVSTIDNEGKWLLLVEYMGSSGRAKILLHDIEREETKPVVDNFDNIYEAVVSDGYIYLKTNKDNAENWKIEKVDCETLKWATAIPEHEKDVIDYFGITDDKIVVTYMHDVASKLYIYIINSEEKGYEILKDIKLPVLGSVHGMTISDDGEIFLNFSSYAYPPAIFRYSEENELETFWRAEVPVDVENIVTEQIFYESKDGTKIPMFIVYKKGLEKNGKNHTMLRGYGGFNVTYPLYFSAANAVWIETGGIVAIANIRGGGEYGRKWHRAGMLESKQNTFDDFAWAMKYLSKEGFASPEKISIWGGSNGGLLTGAMVTQYPELFKAALVAVPLLDMLRFHKFLIGRYWVSEYGSSDDEEQFKYIHKYSPYHNIEKNKKYPAVLLTAGEHDSRVHPMHAKKMAAALQLASGSENPVFLWVDTKSGHGQGKSTKLRIREAAMEFGFFLKMLGVD